MKFRLLLPVSVVLVFLFASCASAPKLRDEKLLHDASLVTGSPCAAPCWRGITPGETLWDDALTILADDATLENVKVEPVKDTDSIVANWQEVDGNPCCQMATEDGETVQSIFVLVAPEVRLGEVVEKYGPPEYVIGGEVSSDQAVMYLFYSDPPMLLYTFVAGKDGVLSASSEVIGFAYFAPDQIDVLVENNNFHAWEGYKSFQDYADSEFIVTAIPTETATPKPD
jgi:hypothetical protein